MKKHSLLYNYSVDTTKTAINLTKQTKSRDIWTTRMIAVCPETVERFDQNHQKENFCCYTMLVLISLAVLTIIKLFFSFLCIPIGFCRWQCNLYHTIKISINSVIYIYNIKTVWCSTTCKLSCGVDFWDWLWSWTLHVMLSQKTQDCKM